MLIAKHRFNTENVRDYKFVQIMENKPQLRINLFVRKIKEAELIEDSTEGGNLPAEVPWEMEEVLVDSIEVDLESLFLPHTRFALPMTTQERFNPPFNFEEIHASRDGVNMLSFFQDMDNKYTFTIFFGETADEFLLISPFPLQNEDAVTRNNTKEVFSDIICEYYPEYKKKIALRDARRDMLLNTDPNDSLSYIEAQLDIVTRVILELVKANPAVKQAVPEFDEFEAAFASTSLFNIKPFDKCLGEITKLKAQTRELQKRYYEAKENINA